MIIVNIKWIENENFSPYLLLDEHVHKSEKKKKALKPINKSIKKSLVPSLDKINDLLFEFNVHSLFLPFNPYFSTFIVCRKKFYLQR